MPYDVSWLQEDRAGFIRYVGTLSLDDIEGAYSQFSDYLETASGRLHLVFDLTQLNELDTNINEILGSPAVQSTIRHPNLGWVVYFDKQNPTFNFMASAIGQNADLRMRFCDSHEEAMQFLDEIL